mmetsp:Transcript_121250/g.223065  ORF Transcript_121250/g.223065 Transcript_121250/m.223065 type:complete len:139 (-) Transcript_121250:77-493(-)
MEPAAAFAVFSEGKDHLDLEDLSCAMIAIFGFKFKKQDLRVLFSSHASPAVHGVDLQGFQAIVAERRRLLGERDRAYRMFTALDKESQGYLDLRSFHDACASACRPAAARSREIFFEMDRSQSGAVTFTDFESYLAGV